jgi:hypothetical protein
MFRRIGRIPLYAPADLDAWVTSKLGPPMRSTSEAAATVAALAGDLNDIGASDRPANPLEREGHSHA